LKCTRVGHFPKCEINEKHDQIKDVSGVRPDGSPQPALTIVHGTKDMIVPYVNAQEIFERARKIMLQSNMVNMPDAGHVPWNLLLDATDHGYLGTIMV
jgi:fermentation-respiration switch protein FrsA (DUF1100 family)